MKPFLTSALLLLSIYLAAQDSTRPIEPGQTTSFENYKVLILAILGLLLLMGLRFWFKRTRKQ